MSHRIVMNSGQREETQRKLGETFTKNSNLGCSVLLQATKLTHSSHYTETIPFPIWDAHGCSLAEPRGSLVQGIIIYN